MTFGPTRALRVAAALALSAALVAGVGSAASTVAPENSGQYGESAAGEIAVLCSPSTRAAIDPIRGVGTRRLSHLHDFFGATMVGPSLDVADLLSRQGTCRHHGDHSSYWAPVLMQNRIPVDPVAMAVYIAVPGEIRNESLVLPPNGLEMVSFRSAWKCSRLGTLSSVAPACAGNALTHLVLEFPRCWDGRRLTGSGDIPNVVPSDGECPSSHPVTLPIITMEIRYDLASSSGLTLSSGGIQTAHGDLFFAWSREALEVDGAACLKRRVHCGVTWSTGLGA